MRLCLLIFFQLSLNWSIGQSLLDQKISVSFTNSNLSKAITQVESVSGQRFSFNSKQLQLVDNSYTKKFENASLGQVLDYLFANTSLQYKEIGGQISIYPVVASTGTVVLSGFVRDNASKEELIGARLYFPSLGIGCISNTYGYYAIEIPKGKTNVIVASIGMEKYIDTIDFQNDLVMNFNLKQNNMLLSTVEVRRDTLKLNDTPINLSNLDKTTITKKAILDIPSVAGEHDLIKFIQLLPGVQPTEDGGANFSVRGSPTGGNLILIDEIPVYHPTHMLGVYSIINVEAVKSASLYKDYIPLRFGGRSSSVLQIHTNEGNLEKTHLSGGINISSLRLNLEGPIVKNRASYYISGRKSLLPRLSYNLLNQSNFILPNFHDLNGKVNVHLNSNNRIYFTGYYGRDRLRDSSYLYKWGNSAGSFRWNHIINSKTFSNLTFTHSQFDYGFATSNLLKTTKVENEDKESFSQSVVQDKLSYDITNFYSNSLKIDFGFDITSVRTGRTRYADSSAFLFLERSSFENGFYVSVEKKINKKLTLSGGIRTPFSFHYGQQDTVSYLNSDMTSTEVIYDKNKPYDLIFSLDPRLLLNYKLGKKDQLSFAAGIVSQHTHLVSYQANFLPVNIWTTSNAYLKPERNHSASFGWVHQEKIVQFSSAIYGKYVSNVLDFALPNYTTSQEIESNLLSGRLLTYGAEFQVNFQPAKWYTAMFSYTYARTNQKVEGINNNLSYVALNDRPHYLNFSQYFNISAKWKIATNFIFHSGRAVTLPTGQFLIGQTAFPVFPEERNAERLPQYERLDFSVTRKLGVKRKKYWGELVLSVTNTLGKYNPSIVYIDPQSIGTSKLAVISKDYAPTTIVLSFNFKI